MVVVMVVVVVGWALVPLSGIREAFSDARSVPGAAVAAADVLVSMFVSVFVIVSVLMFVFVFAIDVEGVVVVLVAMSAG